MPPARVAHTALPPSAPPGYADDIDAGWADADNGLAMNHPGENVMDGQNVSVDETNWGMFAHLSALIGFVIPFGSLIAPLVIWQTKGKETEFVATEAKEALNFQITMAIAFLIAGLLMFVLIGFLLIGLLAIADLVLVLVAAITASKGQPYRYPFALRLVK